MEHITKDRTIVRRITDRNVTDEYAVGKHARLILVYLIDAEHEIAVSPSVHLVGEGASAQVIGALIGRGQGIIRMKTMQHHDAPGTTSNLLVKSVLEDGSRSVYEGSIVVDPKAQRTDAYQRNENLLLSDRAHAVSSPALEILANDVRCTHGAVVKTLQDEELWYLSSRGIGRNEALLMMRDGFLLSACDGIADTIVRDDIRERISGLLKGA